MTKAICLFSGGLDSLLAAEHISRMGIDVERVWMDTGFHHASVNMKTRGKDYASISEGFRKKYGVDVTVIDIRDEFARMLKNPSHGYGKNVNPCIDCKIMMMKRAKAYMYEQGAEFLISGEVSGQRPMSQHKNMLLHIEKEAGVNGILVRPLCAKHLEPTRPELEGILDREKLLDFSGRNRKPQMALAEEYRITDYPSPAGGCILTEEVFGERLTDYLDHGNVIDNDTAALLSVGRHFRISDTVTFICGRIKWENGFLESFSEKGVLAVPADVPGPTGCFFGPAEENDLLTGCSIIARYMNKAENPVKFNILFHGDRTDTVEVDKMADEGIDGYRIGQ